MAHSERLTALCRMPVTESWTQEQQTNTNTEIRKYGNTEIWDTEIWKYGIHKYKNVYLWICGIGIYEYEHRNAQPSTNRH